ncbi:hypothetical protein ABZ557_11885 [Streptomyces sp. NPDC019645]|uniref:GHMP family kinase ATP-binding protein n=1 Tax=unclassified Streptomyces TaxID=2593676 RepID=UPI0033CA29A8
MIVVEAPEPTGGVPTVDSVIPEGKGLAGSSADLVATARAVGQALGLPMPASGSSDCRRASNPPTACSAWASSPSTTAAFARARSWVRCRPTVAS